MRRWYGASRLQCRLEHPFKYRLAYAIDRCDRDEHIEAEEHVTFESIEGLFAMLTPKRMELLPHLHQHPASSIKSLAEALGRDYKRVHEDVAALISIGLIVRNGTRLRAPHSEIRFALNFGQQSAAA